MTCSSTEPSQNVIPTEDPAGPSGGIYEKSRSALARFLIDSSAHSLRSLGRNDNQIHRRHADLGPPPMPSRHHEIEAKAKISFRVEIGPEGAMSDRGKER